LGTAAVESDENMPWEQSMATTELTSQSAARPGGSGWLAAGGWLAAETSPSCYRANRLVG
jgi:hypothetical protein